MSKTQHWLLLACPNEKPAWPDSDVELPKSPSELKVHQTKKHQNFYQQGQRSQQDDLLEDFQLVHLPSQYLSLTQKQPRHILVQAAQKLQLPRLEEWLQGLLEGLDQQLLQDKTLLEKPCEENFQK